MAFGSLILTNAANSFTAQAWASSGVITITRVGFGSGFPGVTDFVPGYTGLKVPVMNGTITGINNLVAGQLTVRSNISSANAPFTFNVNEIGVFGKFQGGAETLLAYCTTGANTGDTVVPTGGGTPVVKDYALLMIWQQAISSSGVIQLIQQVGLHAGSHYNTGVDPIAVATSSHTGMLPVSPGDGLQSPISTSPVTWAPILLAITVDTTLYVSTTGNDSTAKPNDASHPWLTIQGALNYLSPYFITPSAFVTISVAAGLYSTSTGSIVNHQQGSQIKIIGTLGASTSITAEYNMTGSYGEYVVTFNVSSSSGFSIGDYAFVQSVNGIPAAMVMGVYPVTAVVAGQISISMPAFVPSLGYIGPITGTITKMATVLKSLADINCIYVSSPTGLNLLKNIAITGNNSQTGGGVTISGPGAASVDTVGVYAYNSPALLGKGFFIASNAIVNLSNCSASQCGEGVYPFGSGTFVTCSGVYCNFNYDYGFRCENGCDVILVGSFAFANGSSGARSSTSIVLSSGFWSYYNAVYGVECSHRGYFASTVGQSFSAGNNVSGGINIGGFSVVDGVSSTFNFQSCNLTNGQISAAGVFTY